MSKKLNIAHLHWGFPPIIGGVETHLTILLPQFVEMGHNVSLLTGSFEGVPGEYKYKGVVDIFRNPIMDLNWLGKRGLNGLSGEIKETFNKFIERTEPDILHTHNMHYFSKPHIKALQELARKKGIPIILTAHNVWDDNLFLDLTKNTKWAHIIAVSHFIKRELIGTGSECEKITVVHHGIDQHLYDSKMDTAPLFKKYPQLRGKRIVFHPARMGLAKGCDVTIKALRTIKNRFPDVMMVLAGTKNIIDWAGSHQKDIAYMVGLIKLLKLEKNVLIDTYRLEDMPMLYAASEICLYPSSASEPFGLTMIEALASSRPMIVTETGGMPEIIKDGINGYVIPVRDFESLASRIVNLLTNSDLKNRLGGTGRQMVEQQYTKEVLAQNTLNVYRKFC